MGADDYITKPFSQRLLIERIKAVLRRAEANKPGAEETSADKMILRGPLSLDPARHRCLWNGEDVTLLVTRFLLLGALAQIGGESGGEKVGARAWRRGLSVS